MVTGVGRAMFARLARRLSTLDHVDLVVGVDTHAPRRPGNVRFLRAAPGNPVVGATMQSERIDTLVHGAIHATPRAAGGRRQMKEHNVIGSMHLFGAAQATDSLRQVVLKSSTAAYGSSADDPSLFTESHPSSRTVTGFGRDVVDVEGYATGLARRRPDLTVTTLRFANFIGGVDDSALAGFFALPVLPSVLGWDPRLQFCHADDAVAVLTRAVLEPVGGIFNVAGDGAVYLSQAIRQAGRMRVPVPQAFVDSVAALLLRSGRVDVPVDQLPFLRFGRVVDLARLEHEFGFTPQYTTPEAFAAFLSRRTERGFSRRDLLALQAELRHWLLRPTTVAS